MAVGKVEGTGSLIKVSLPFTPRHVVLHNLDGLARLVWTSTMEPDSGIKTITAGTMSAITADGITAIEQLKLDDEADPGRGFTIGTDADINVSAEFIHYVAYE
jgi:hypothetical protein